VLPDSLVFFQRVMRCVHSGYSSSRAVKKERYQASTRYTGCQARITAESILENGEWAVVVRMEVSSDCD